MFVVLPVFERSVEQLDGNTGDIIEERLQKVIF